MADEKKILHNPWYADKNDKSDFKTGDKVNNIPIISAQYSNREKIGNCLKVTKD